MKLFNLLRNIARMNYAVELISVVFLSGAINIITSTIYEKPSWVFLSFVLMGAIAFFISGCYSFVLGYKLKIIYENSIHNYKNSIDDSVDFNNILEQKLSDKSKLLNLLSILIISGFIGVISIAIGVIFFK